MNRSTRGLLTDERGLTLVEVLAAITILAVITVTLISYFVAAMERSADESRRIIAANLARMKAAELRQMVKDKDLDSAGNYKLFTKNDPDLLQSDLQLTTSLFPDNFSSSKYSDILNDSEINGTTYKYAIYLNPNGVSARTTAVQLKVSDYRDYLLPVRILVYWEGDGSKAAKTTTLDSYLIERG